MIPYLEASIDWNFWDWDISQEQNCHLLHVLFVYLFIYLFVYLFIYLFTLDKFYNKFTICWKKRDLHFTKIKSYETN